MPHRKSTTLRVLAVVPSSKGFGFAVLEDPLRLVDWGFKSVSKDKNLHSLAKAKELIAHYSPHLLALPQLGDPGCRQSPRIQELIRELIRLSGENKLEVKQIGRKSLKTFFFNDQPNTKHDLAVFLAKAFPQELAVQLPPKRRLWMSEDYRIDLFSAVALAVIACSGCSQQNGISSTP